MLKHLLLIITFVVANVLYAQPPKGVQWTKTGNGYYVVEEGNIVEKELSSQNKKIIVPSNRLIPAGMQKPIEVRNFFFSNDMQKLLIYTNSKRVWRRDTRGDYWIFDIVTNKLSKLGKNKPESSLMFAKFSPDSRKVAYVSGHNIYSEDIATGTITQLTKDGNDRIINGTFDWAYEEEFDCRDGFRWSPDSKYIAFWQLDATKIRNFLMINNTDSIYSFTIPVEYPKTGDDPSKCRIGIVSISSPQTKWMNIPGDPQQHYVTRMEWLAGSGEIILQQLNRKQNASKIFICDIKSGSATNIYSEKDNAWIDTKARWSDSPEGWEWVADQNKFLWVSEKDGWRHIYLVSKDGKDETLLTKGNYDIISLEGIDEKNGYVYFMASPDNATQKYLYRINMNTPGSAAEPILQNGEKGTHSFDISPNCQYAYHTFSNANSYPAKEWVSIPDGKVVFAERSDVPPGTKARNKTEFFQVTTEDNITLDGWMIKPKNFDPSKKYPVLFYVYSEPAAQTVTDAFGATGTFLYRGDMAEEGYIQISLDGRGTPAPKGAEWRKSIYRKIGIVNIRDQAMAANKILQWSFVDTSRIAVWGWSGGGSATLNLLFQYPDIYKTGVSIAPVANLLTYDNIYQERYMGLPQENKQDYIDGSPITYAKYLKGNLLLIHGTGDDNVHYQNSEMLLNELIKQDKLFQFMPYPNRSHSLGEGEGTFMHLTNIFTEYIRTKCPGGGR